MKTIIAGSRDIRDYATVRDAADSCPWQITEVVSGTCRGVDWLGERWARNAGLPVARFPADWEAHGKAAGPIRNAEMADYADALIAVHNGSRGTLDMIAKARLAGLKVHEVRL